VSEPTEFLDLDDLIDLARRLLGDPPPIRDGGLLAAAVARPQTSIAGQDAYPDVWTKAAALMQSLVNGHPLVDGNKRLGWLATAVFLELNGASMVAASNDEVYDLVMRVAGGSPSIDEIAATLRELGG
jgi:death on curing protein